MFEIEGWRPGIGDPTIWGWLTVANYALAVVMAVKAARADWRNSQFWAFLAMVMLALGINKQLDLQSLLTAVFRNNAIRHGWYDHRREMQKMFIEGTILAAAAGMVVVAFAFRRAGRWVVGALFGLALLCAFVAARAASFHHMDEMLNLRFLALRMNHILENTGIGIIAVSAAMARRQVRGGARRRPRR